MRRRGARGGGCQPSRRGTRRPGPRGRSSSSARTTARRPARRLRTAGRSRRSRADALRLDPDPLPGFCVDEYRQRLLRARVRRVHQRDLLGRPGRHGPSPCDRRQRADAQHLDARDAARGVQGERVDTQRGVVGHAHLQDAVAPFFADLQELCRHGARSPTWCLLDRRHSTETPSCPRGAGWEDQAELLRGRRARRQHGAVACSRASRQQLPNDRATSHDVDQAVTGAHQALVRIDAEL